MTVRILLFTLMLALGAKAGENADSIRLFGTLLQGEGLAFSKPDSALLYLEQCLADLNRLEEDRGERPNWATVLRTSLYNDLGFIIQRKGNWNDAIRMYQAALDLQGDNGNPANIAPLQSNLANLYLQAGNYKLARKHAEEALRTFRSEKDLAGMMNCTNLLGEIEKKRGNYPAAESYFRMSIEMGKGIEIVRTNLLRSYELLGISKFEQQKYREAEEIFHLGIAVGSTGNVKISLFNIYYYLAQVALFRSKLSDAAHYADSAYYFSMNNNYPAEQIKSTALLSDIRYRLNDFRSAADLLRLSNSLREKFNNEKMANEINLLESEKKEMRFEMNRMKDEEKIRNQRNTIMAGIMFLVLFIVLLLLTYRNYLNKKRSHAEIALKNRIIEEKQRDIIASIHYAKRIQNGLLPTDKYIAKKLNDLNKA
ncbi:MAG: tetratricopeptide repeat protein [Bacteroidia bacterium]|nr:tetratricopeptide repeat protein [Bacteroidia bacterium]